MLLSVRGVLASREAEIALLKKALMEAEAAPQQEAQEPCPTCVALARAVMLDQVSFDRKPDCYGIRQITDDEGVEEWEDIRTSPDVAREEANDMMATGRGEIYEVVPLWTTPQPSPTAQAAESVPAIQGEMNVQLDIDSNHSAPGQQRDVARSVALGQPMGNGQDQAAGRPSAQGDKLLTVAERNIRSFLRSAQFKSESDREAALNCVDVLWAAARALSGIRYNDEQDHIDFARAVLAKWGTQPQAGAVPQGWKAVPVNPTPEMWKAAKSVPDPNPPYPPHYGLVWDAMLAASPTSPAEQQAPSAAAADTVVLEAALRAIHQAIDLIGEPDTERLRTVRRVLRGAVIVAEDAGEAATAPQPAPAPLSDDVVKDAARWRMAALIGNEVMMHPDKRTHATAAKAYMDATHSGSDLTGAVDAALAAQGGN